jgi:hypothetical protein
MVQLKTNALHSNECMKGIGKNNITKVVHNFKKKKVSGPKFEWDMISFVVSTTIHDV